MGWCPLLTPPTLRSSLCCTVGCARYFATGEHDACEEFTFHRSNAFDAVAAEVAAVRTDVGVLDMATFSKYEVTGPCARAWLDCLLAGKLPAPGRMALAPMLGDNGHLMGDLTVACLPGAAGGPETFMLYGSGYLQGFHMRWFAQMRARELGGVPATDVTVRNVTDDVGGVAVSGPKARELLQRLVLDPSAVSHDNMRFMSVRRMDVGLVPATVARVSVTGELGYEVTVPSNQVPRLYGAMASAGGELGLRPIGSYALNSLRLEKGVGIWSREYTPEFTPWQSSLGRFVALDKQARFVGRDAATEHSAQASPGRTLVTLQVHTTSNADAWGYEPVWTADGGTYLGFTTSGGFGHSVGSSLALAYLDTELIGQNNESDSSEGLAVSVHVLGDATRATVLPVPPHDPQGRRMLGP